MGGPYCAMYRLAISCLKRSNRCWNKLLYRWAILVPWKFCGSWPPLACAAAIIICCCCWGVICGLPWWLMFC